MTSDAAQLIREWTGPYGGVPPFDRIDVDGFAPALEHAMQEQLAEIDRIASQSEPPTFENTIATLERSGRALDRVLAVYGVWSSNMSTPAFQSVERDMAPRLAEFSDRITQNEPLFERIAVVYDARENAGLDAEQQRLAWLHYVNFVRAGARLDASDKKRLSQLNQRLAALFTQFQQNLLADEASHRLLIEDEAELRGLPESARRAAAAAAAEEGLAKAWLIRNTRSAIEPLLAFADDRALRERAWRMWTQRCDRGDEHDNNGIVKEILELRAERAALLGYETHAHWRMEHSMASDPARALELLQSVWGPATARVRHDLDEMRAIAGAPADIEPWDYRYYAEKVRRARFDLDQDEIRQYLQLDRMRDAMFHVARELLGFEFQPAVDVPVYHPDVTAWQVVDHASGRHVGLWYFDPFARPGKRSGAWMTAYRVQERFEQPITPIVSNNANFMKAAPGEPVLISWDDALTLFHEFGHALHGLASNVAYPSLSGTAVPRDYVEFPSQLLEHWLSTPEVLETFAIHHATGEPIPHAIVERIERAATFNGGLDTTEYLASAFVDLRLHIAPTPPADPAAFERDVLRELGMPREVAMRHRIPHFAHLFSSDQYSAGYYSYIWADVLTADAFEAFREAGSPWDPAVAQRLRENVLARGNTIDPAEAYRRFRGRDAEIEPLLRKRGLVS